LSPPPQIWKRLSASRASPPTRTICAHVPARSTRARLLTFQS
jgi:hypothetical protein